MIERKTRTTTTKIAYGTLLESGLPAAEVMDLIPVKPLSEMGAGVGEMDRTRPPALFQKIKP
jgi:pyrroline-5-carboxylate reductase